MARNPAQEILHQKHKEKKIRIKCDSLEMGLILRNPYGQLGTQECTLIWTREVNGNISIALRYGNDESTTKEITVSGRKSLGQKSRALKDRMMKMERRSENLRKMSLTGVQRRHYSTKQNGWEVVLKGLEDFVNSLGAGKQALDRRAAAPSADSCADGPTVGVGGMSGPTSVRCQIKKPTFDQKKKSQPS